MHDRRRVAADFTLAASLGALTILLVLFLQKAGMEPGPLSLAAMFGVPAVVVYTFLARPLRFSLGITVLLLAGNLYRGVYGKTEARVRSFFGVHRVTIDPDRLIPAANPRQHDTRPAEPRPEPAPEPADLLSFRWPGRPRLRGPGIRCPAEAHRPGRPGDRSLSCYARPGQRWTFFEIDPAVIYLARNSGLFTYLRDC